MRDAIKYGIPRWRTCALLGLFDELGPGQDGVQSVDQLAGYWRRSGQGEQRRGVDIQDPVGHLVQQEQRSLRDSAGTREPPVGESSGNVQQRNAFGTALDDHPGQVGNVGRDGWSA